jgi:hypothetical protein
MGRLSSSRIPVSWHCPHLTFLPWERTIDLSHRFQAFLPMRSSGSCVVVVIVAAAVTDRICCSASRLDWSRLGDMSSVSSFWTAPSVVASVTNVIIGLVVVQMLLM